MRPPQQPAPGRASHWRVCGCARRAPRVVVGSRSRLGRAGRTRPPRRRSAHASGVIARRPLSPRLTRCAMRENIAQPHGRLAWGILGCLSHNVACGLGGDVRATEGCLTRLRGPSPSLARPPFPRPAPQDLPEVLPYPILRRLSSTRHRRAAPRAAGLPALMPSRSITTCGVCRAPPHAPRPVGRGRAAQRFRLLGISGCPSAAVRLSIRWGVASRSDGQSRLVPGLHPPREDRDRGKVVRP